MDLSRGWLSRISETPERNPIEVNMADVVACGTLKRQEECPVA